MFCPNCRSEYRAGFSWCNDCHAALVAELAPEEEQFTKLVEVLSTADAGEVALIESILGAGEIPYLTQGKNFNLGRNIPIRIMVPEECLQEARELLADFL